MSHRIARASLLAFALTACVTTTDETTPMLQPSDSPWLEPSMQLGQQIEDQAAKVPWTHATERIELIAWFAQTGEPAYTTLFGLCQDPRPDVAGCGYAALGATGDKRLVPYLREVPLAEDAPPSLRFERARCLARLGDWSQLGIIIAGLRDETLWTRVLCDLALFQITGEHLGYDPHASPEEREIAVKRWESWQRNRTGDPLLAAK